MTLFEAYMGDFDADKALVQFHRELESGNGRPVLMGWMKDGDVWLTDSMYAHLAMLRQLLPEDIVASLWDEDPSDMEAEYYASWSADVKYEAYKLGFLHIGIVGDNGAVEFEGRKEVYGQNATSVADFMGRLKTEIPEIIWRAYNIHA
jgi:hypothetical protein